MLEKEIETYNKLVAGLLEQNPQGGFAVIKGTELLGIWQSRKEAVKEGTSKFGRISFLVKSIRPEDNVIFMPNLFIKA